MAFRTLLLEEEENGTEYSVAVSRVPVSVFTGTYTLAKLKRLGIENT